MGRPAERREQPRGHHCVVDRRPRALLEPASQPSRGRSPAAHARVVLRDQRRELEGFAQVDLADLAGSRLGEQEIAALEGATEGRSRMPLGCDAALLPGAGRPRKPSGAISLPRRAR
jgi:hypothetical protein